MSGNDRSIRPHRRSDGPGEQGVTTRSEARESLSETTPAVANMDLSASPARVETDAMRATLLGVPRVPIHDFVYAHRLDGSHEQGETRQVAMFDIENTSDRPLRWQSSRTTFIGDDDYTYEESPLSLDPEQLGPGCHTRQVEVEPGRKARLVTMVERLPCGVEVSEVVHTLAVRNRVDTERLVFSVE